MFCAGTFDLFHAGHVNFLRQCAEVGRPVVVAVNTDEFAARYKRAPILSLNERRATLEACKYADMVFINKGNEDTGLTIDWLNERHCTRWPIKYIAHGDDWGGESLLQQLGISQAWLDERGIEMLEIPYTSGVSTSEIMERMRSRIWEDQNRRVGFDWDFVDGVKTVYPLQPK